MVSHGSSVVCFTPRVIFPFSISSLRILTCTSRPSLRTSPGCLTLPQESSPIGTKPSMPPMSTKAPASIIFTTFPETVWPSEMFAIVSFFFSSLCSSRITLLDTTMPLSLFWIMRVSIVWPTISSKSAIGRRATCEPGRKTLKGLPRPISQLKPPFTLLRIFVETGSLFLNFSSIALFSLSWSAFCLEALTVFGFGLSTSTSISEPTETSYSPSLFTNWFMGTMHSNLNPRSMKTASESTLMTLPFAISPFSGSLKRDSMLSSSNSSKLFSFESVIPLS